MINENVEKQNLITYIDKNYNRKYLQKLINLHIIDMLFPGFSQKYI